MKQHQDDRTALVNRMKARQTEAGQAAKLAETLDQLIAELESMATDYDELADAWEACGELAQANQTRQEAMQVRNFAGTVSAQAKANAHDADVLVQQVKAGIASIIQRQANNG